MEVFIVKTVSCLTVLYLFYILFLRITKSLTFNRYYLLFSLFFAMLIPFMVIDSSFFLPITIDRLFNVSREATGLPAVDGAMQESSSWQGIILIFYLAVSLLLLIRFLSNIWRIVVHINRSLVVEDIGASLVLVKEKILPYSFMKYIFVNRNDFEEGRIEDELLLHERVHCQQYHTIDVIIIELLKIVLWFNPLIWLFGRSIQLNHEYLADNGVISQCRLNDYQNTLINTVFRNNSIYLASHFKYSSVKKRLLMMEKKNSERKVLRIIVTIPLFLFLGLVFASAQDTKKEQVKQSETVVPPPPPAAEKKVIKGDDGKFYVITPDGKKVEADELNAPPPPPPPPPGSEAEMKKKKMEQVKQAELKQMEEQKKQAEMKAKQEQLEKLEQANKEEEKAKKEKLKEGKMIPPPPPPPSEEGKQ